MFISITDAKYIDDYKIKFKFNNGIKGTVDFEQKLWGEAFESLKDKVNFKDFSLKYDTITWSNGADFAPETIAEWIST
jgi:hypothetical protein